MFTFQAGRCSCLLQREPNFIWIDHTCLLSSRMNHINVILYSVLILDVCRELSIHVCRELSIQFNSIKYSGDSLRNLDDICAHSQSVLHLQLVPSFQVILAMRIKHFLFNCQMNYRSNEQPNRRTSRACRERIEFQPVKPVKPTQPNVVFNPPSTRAEPTQPRPTYFYWGGPATNHKPENPTHEQGELNTPFVQLN